MAIPFNLPDIGRRIGPEETGIPDYIAALSRGMDLGYKPGAMQRKAYAEQLANKINEAKAKYAMEQELARLQYTQAGTSHLGAQTRGINLENQALPQKLSLDNQIRQAKLKDALYNAQQNEVFNNLLSRSPSNTGGQEGASGATDQRTGNAPTDNILVAGNPNLQHINEVYEQYPQYRKKLESMGFKKQQTVKFDPRTGATSVITQMPNGQVQVRSSVASSDMSPATIATKTAAQKALTAITNARPIIQKIIDETDKGEVPGQWVGKYFHPDIQAAYESDVIQSSDTLAGALGFPATDKGLASATATVMRKPRESDNGYKKRLKALLADMDEREKTAKNNLGVGISTGSTGTSVNKGRMKYNAATGRLE